MKPKKVNKKLTFSKSTIADLNSKEVNDVRGGGTGGQNCSMKTCFLTECDTCIDTCPNSCFDTCINTCDYTCYHGAGTACHA